MQQSSQFYTALIIVLGLFSISAHSAESVSVHLQGASATFTPNISGDSTTLSINCGAGVETVNETGTPSIVYNIPNTSEEGSCDYEINIVGGTDGGGMKTGSFHFQNGLAATPEIHSETELRQTASSVKANSINDEGL